MSGVGVIKTFIPHRFPILLVDRVLEVVPRERITTLKAVTCNEPWFAELPDGTPDDGYAYPIALLVESWCQTAALLSAWPSLDGDATETADQVALFGGMSGIEILRPVLPGDVIRHEVRITKELGDTWIFEGNSTVDGSPVMVVDSLMTALRPSSVLQQVPA
jgi:3-hydroxyacyl-[acyl-carrier-protein] dehydratase